MKKAFLCSAFCLCSLASMGQVNFTEFITVPNYQVNSQGKLEPIQGSPFQQGSTYQRSTTKQTFPVVGGYYVDSNNKLKRVKIRVNGVSNLGQPSVYLRGVYNADYNMWNDCNTQAVKVVEVSDGEYLANNFEWKVSSQFYGTIYFNY